MYLIGLIWEFLGKGFGKLEELLICGVTFLCFAYVSIVKVGIIC